MRINVSHGKEFLECPKRAYYLNVKRRRSRRQPLALEIGKLWHHCMELYLKGLPKPEVLASAELLITSDKVRTAWSALIPAFLAWEKPDDWEIIHVEKKFELPLIDTFTSAKVIYRHTLQLTVDTIVKWNDLAWHLQHKTLAPSIKPDKYAVYIQRDWHECLYTGVGGLNLPWGGTILNGVRKLSAKTIAENPSQALFKLFIPRPGWQIARAYGDFARLTTLIEKHYNNEAGEEAIFENRSACGGHFGNSLCPFIGVCNDEKFLDDDTLFEDNPDRYGS